VSPTTIALLIVLGAAVGLFGTLVGAGGGFILTPILLLVYPSDNPSTITAISLVRCAHPGGDAACGAEHREPAQRH
jgi:uncharacterized membrane protein YfcA